MPVNIDKYLTRGKDNPTRNQMSKEYDSLMECSDANEHIHLNQNDIANDLMNSNQMRDDIYKVDALKKIKIDMSLCMKIPT